MAILDIQPMQTPVGIDLGTTFSVVAYLDDLGRPVIVPNEFGDHLTPSAVLFHDGQVTVGRQAVRQATANPAAYVDGFKRDIGERFCRQKVLGFDVPPEVLSGFVLRYLKSYAKERLGRVVEAVITVPAFFDETRRQSTFEAARLAGLGVLDIINEPTAAAVAYALDSRILDRERGFVRPENFLVYDLGGGTFDVTVLHVEGWTMRALATDGDVRLGGRDFDERLVGLIADRFLEQYGLDPRADPAQCARLWVEAEQAKHAISAQMRTTVPIHYVGVDAQIEVTREDLERLISDLVGRTETTMKQVVDAASLGWRDISRILLVGGATRMPMIPEMIWRLTGKRPEVTLSPDEAVARGAAIYAGLLLKSGAGAEFDQLKLVNVSSHSLGIVGREVQTRRLINSVLIPRNSPLPAQARRSFPLARQGQRHVSIPIVEGEARQPDECVQLGKCLVDDLPEDLPPGTKVAVEFTLDASGLITVTATIPGSRRGARVQITRDNERDVGSLDDWCKQLSSPPRKPAEPVVPVAPEQALRSPVLKELDDLYAELGKAAMWNSVPPTAATDKQAAVRTFRELEEAQRAAAAAEQRQSASMSRAERIQATSDVAQGKARVRELQQRYNYHLIGLGRLVMKHRIMLPDTMETMRRIERLQDAMPGR